MGADRGSPADALSERLYANPYQFDFFQLVRRLQCAHPNLPAVGTSKRPEDDAVRFSQVPHTNFATSTIHSFRQLPTERAPRLFVNFMGLLGPNGPMPIHLSDYARQRERNHRDPTIARFFDVFNHRMISLFFRAWSLSQPGVLYEQTPKTDFDPFSFQVGSSFGLGQASLRRRDALPDEAKLSFAGRLSSQSPNPEGLCAILREYYGVPARIEEFVGKWTPLPEVYRCKLGGPREAASLGSSAGIAAVGERFWDCQGQFRIVMGPMSLAAYQRLLPLERAHVPGGRSFARLEAWILNYLGFEFTWQVNLVLKREEVPRLRMGGKSDDPGAARLGWTTWLASKPIESDRADLVISPVAR